jgi:AAA+ superfamily predicted ATPase
MRGQSPNDFAKMIRRQHHRLLGAPCDVFDLDDLDAIPALERQIFPQRGQVKDLMHQVAQMALPHRR